MKKYLCIGGPWDGKKRGIIESLVEDYSQFNASYCHTKSKERIRRRLLNGEIISPSCVLIHKSIFKAMYDKYGVE